LPQWESKKKNPKKVHCKKLWCVEVRDAGKKGNGLFACTNITKQAEVTCFMFPNVVDNAECGKTQIEKEDWWWSFSTANGLPLDNVIYGSEGLTYDFQPPGEGSGQSYNCWFFINHSLKHANVEPV